jgi:hypothetical protein
MVKWIAVMACVAACGDNTHPVVASDAGAGGVLAELDLPDAAVAPPLTEPFVAEVARAYCDYLQACFPDVYAQFGGFVACIHTTARDLVLPAAPTDQCMEDLLGQSCSAQIVIPKSCTDYGM